METSLAVARDRVIGILLGLFMMWLVFDRLWSMPAAVAVKKAFVANFRLLAQLAREPVSSELRTGIKRGFLLRESINAQFDTVRSLADGVLFEFGPSRRASLETRTYIRQWQPQLRALFVMRLASLKYRLNLPGFELPETVRLRQQEYDEHSARMLEEMAARIEHHPSPYPASIEHSHELLNKTIEAAEHQGLARLPAGQAQTFVTLLRGIDGLTTSLASEIPAEPRA
jgi:multidrug resistance protein MdtO